MITIQNLSKKFRIGFEKNESILARVWFFISRNESKREFKVLDNISFSVKAGEIVALIGRNGSGKSTLLRTIAGIYKQDQGIIKANGRIISIIGLQKGFKKKLTLKDNIFLCCSMFGIKKSSIKKNVKSIISFAELEEYVNTKLYQFSTGMKTRLAISIAIHGILCSDAKILLLDEVFSGGDPYFKEKSHERIKKIINSGISVILASHRMDFVKKECDRAIWIDKGRIRMDSKSRFVVESYLKS